MTGLFNKFVHGVRSLNNTSIQSLYLEYLKNLCFERLPSIKEIAKKDEVKIKKIFSSIDSFISSLVKERGKLINCKPNRNKKSRLFIGSPKNLLRKNNGSTEDQIKIRFTEQVKVKIQKNFEQIVSKFYVEFERIKGEVEKEVKRFDRAIEMLEKEKKYIHLHADTIYGLYIYIKRMNETFNLDLDDTFYNEIEENEELKGLLKNYYTTKTEIEALLMKNKLNSINRNYKKHIKVS